MLKVIRNRLILALPLLLITATLAFLLTSFIPGDAAATILGLDASPEQYARVRAELGLDRPIVIQYLDWLWHAVQGDLGDSWRTGRTVVATIVERLPVTLTLAILGIIVTFVVGVVLGLISVLSRGVIGKSAQVVSVLGASVPNFWLGILLVLVFAVQLGVLPATGFVDFGKSPGDWARSLVLPVAAIALAGVATIARQTRASMNEVLGRDSIRTLITAGTPRNTIIFKHAFRNAAIPVVTSLSFQFINLISGAIVIEQVFALPGIGQVLLVAINARDIPIVQGVVVITALLVICVNLLVDLANAWLNPKVRV